MPEHNTTRNDRSPRSNPSTYEEIERRVREFYERHPEAARRISIDYTVDPGGWENLIHPDMMADVMRNNVAIRTQSFGRWIPVDAILNLPPPMRPRQGQASNLYEGFEWSFQMPEAAQNTEPTEADVEAVYRCPICRFYSVVDPEEPQPTIVASHTERSGYSPYSGDGFSVRCTGTGAVPIFGERRSENGVYQFNFDDGTRANYRPRRNRLAAPNSLPRVRVPESRRREDDMEVDRVVWGRSCVQCYYTQAYDIDVTTDFSNTPSDRNSIVRHFTVEEDDDPVFNYQTIDIHGGSCSCRDAILSAVVCYRSGRRIAVRNPNYETLRSLIGLMPPNAYQVEVVSSIDGLGNTRAIARENIPIGSPVYANSDGTVSTSGGVGPIGTVVSCSVHPDSRRETPRSEEEMPAPSRDDINRIVRAVGNSHRDALRLIIGESAYVATREDMMRFGGRITDSSDGVASLSAGRGLDACSISYDSARSIIQTIEASAMQLHFSQHHRCYIIVDLRYSLTVHIPVRSPFSTTLNSMTLAYNYLLACQRAVDSWWAIFSGNSPVSPASLLTAATAPQQVAAAPEMREPDYPRTAIVYMKNGDSYAGDLRVDSRMRTVRVFFREDQPPRSERSPEEYLVVVPMDSIAKIVACCSSSVQRHRNTNPRRMIPQRDRTECEPPTVTVNGRVVPELVEASS